MVSIIPAGIFPIKFYSKKTLIPEKTKKKID